MAGQYKIVLGREGRKKKRPVPIIFPSYGSSFGVCGMGETIIAI